jgi:hypothetical protein
MIPEDDRGPTWLRDYGYTDFSQIEADIQAMEQFAAQLSSNVEKSYAPHLSAVSTAMTTRLPGPEAEFVELQSFLAIHRQAQDAAHQNVYDYANGTQGFAAAAKKVSDQYAGTDAFAHAQVSDVNAALDRAGLPMDQTTAGRSTSIKGDV